jgi:hypothetical protein
MAKGKKHSLVQCRIEACQKVDEIVERDDCSIKEAMRTLSGETGVPAATLNFWYYNDPESNKGDMKVHVPEVPKSTAKTKAKVINKIVDNIAKAQAKEEEAAASGDSLFDAAHELAGTLSGAVLAEELYELFLKRIAEVDKVIKANDQLEEPMRMDNVVDQLLRLARNAGWTEPVVEEPESNTCDKCKVTSCPNKLCKNNKPKKKKGK